MYFLGLKCGPVLGGGERHCFSCHTEDYGRIKVGHLTQIRGPEKLGGDQLSLELG